jgi:hypothetical protein
VNDRENVVKENQTSYEKKNSQETKIIEKKEIEKKNDRKEKKEEKKERKSHI